MITKAEIERDAPYSPIIVFGARGRTIRIMLPGKVIDIDLPEADVYVYAKGCGAPTKLKRQVVSGHSSKAG